jgi:hypothetical protein
MPNLLQFLGLPGFLWDLLVLVIALLSVMTTIYAISILNKRGTIPDDFLLIAQHVFAAPVGALTWILYSNEIQSRYVASIIPLLFVILFAAIVSGRLSNPRTTRLVFKGEDVSVLKAPLLYSLFVLFLTVACWPTPTTASGAPDYDIFVPTAFLVLGPYTGGWGMGHYITRRHARVKFRLFEERSLEGALAIVGFGFITSYFLLSYYHLTNYWSFPSTLGLGSIGLMVGLLVSCVVAALVESVSPSIYDNLFIPLSIIIVVFVLSQLGILGYPAFSFLG